jgi:predicted GNAT family acetyltransferase
MAADDGVDGQVRDNSEESRYEILVDGEVAGVSEYARTPGRIDFLHTEVEDRFGGHGLASRLIKAALDEARAAGEAVLPYCPFVRSFIAKHAEYRDLVPEGDRARFGLA